MDRLQRRGLVLQGQLGRADSPYSPRTAEAKLK